MTIDWDLIAKITENLPDNELLNLADEILSNLDEETVHNFAKELLSGIPKIRDYWVANGEKGK